MRTDAALDIARDPSEHDLDDIVAALVALRLAVVELRREQAASLQQRLDAGTALRERADTDARRDAAVELHERDVARVVQVLGVLDGVAPDEARRLRAAWGIWPEMLK